MENHGKHDHNHGSGFLLGFIIGGIATLLLTTKKGQEILKDLTDKGLKKASQLQNDLSKNEELEVIEGENDYLDIDDRKSLPAAVQEEELVEEKIEEKKESKITAVSKPNRSVKRLFRIKKN